MSQSIYINNDAEDIRAARVRGATDLRSQKFTQFVAGDSLVLDLYLTGIGGALNIQDYAEVRLGIGNLDARPESGSYVVGGSDTLAYDHTAAELETVIDSQIAGATVTQLADFVFKVQFDAVGAQTIPSLDFINLQPRSTVSVTRLVEGDATTKESWLWRLFRDPLAFTNTFTNIDNNGIRGTLSLATAGIYDLLANTDQVQTFFEVELTDASGNVQTSIQARVKLNGEVIGHNFSGTVPSSPSMNPAANAFLETFPDPTFNDKLTISDATDNSFTGIGSGLIVGKTNTHSAENSVTIGENNNAGSTKNSLIVGETNETSQSNSATLGNNNIVGGTGVPFATSGTIYDDFDYASGIYLYNATDGGQGFSGVWGGEEGSSANWRMTGTGRSLYFDQNSTSNTYGLISDGSGHIWCEYSCYNLRNFTSSLPASSTYCTMLVRGYDGGASVAQMRIEFYSSTGAIGNMRLNAGIDQGTLFVSHIDKGYSQGTTLPNALQDEKTYLLAMKRTSSAVYASLIEADGDPNTLLSEPDWQITSSGTTGVSFQSIKLLGNNTNPNTGAGIRVDEIRIADSWEDAVDGMRYDEGSQSIAIGSNNYIGITTDAIAVGKYNSLSGIRSYAIGEGLKDYGDDSTLLLGRYNEDPADDSKLVIASGLSDTVRFTAMEFKARDDAFSNNSGVVMRALYRSASYLNDSQAAAGGVELGELYRAGNDVRIRMA